jgi:hypothetical protein
VDPPDGLLFSAYSKEFGEGETSRVRRATARVRRFPDAHFDDITERAKIEGSDIISEDTGIIGGHKCATIVMRRLDQGVALESHHKVIAGPDCIYEMAVDLLPEYKDEMRPKIDELLGSFLLT